MDLSQLNTIIRKRRSVYPAAYMSDRPIERTLIEQILENANWAPTHKRTEPWRFQVFHSPESRQALGEYIANIYKKNTEKGALSEAKYQKMLQNPQRAGAVIAIIMQRDPLESLPEFEEIAAVAMAVQNMWLSCTAAGLGCYWSTPSAILHAGEWLELEPGQRCLGIFYMGWPEAALPEGKRGDITTRTQWR